MHNIFDLKEMDTDRLRSLASELDVKGFKKMEKDDLVYAILDKEAEQNAKNAGPDKPAKKRGRPKKIDKPAQAEQQKDAAAPKAEPEAAPQAAAVQETAAPQPKKRGRKPKSQIQAETAEKRQDEPAVTVQQAEQPIMAASLPEQRDQQQAGQQKRQKRTRINNNAPQQTAAPDQISDVNENVQKEEPEHHDQQQRTQIGRAHV